MNYKEFLETKQIDADPSGFTPSNKLNSALFAWQKVIVDWTLKRGRAAIFADCGLGKTILQLEWTKHIHRRTKSPILILAPLAVTLQTQKEGRKFHIPVHICESQSDVKNGINITNYEKLHKFNSSEFIGIVLDESGILKNFVGTRRNQIIESFRSTPYRLACTATPAPNDYEELGNHAEFLGIMTRSEMLSMFFINDTSNTGTWRLKGHVKDNVFWKWLASWSAMISKPSDIGFSNEGFVLPKIHYHEHLIKSKEKPSYGLFTKEAQTMEDRRKVRKSTIKLRCKNASSLINCSNKRWTIWCNLNDEGDMLEKLIEKSVQVAGKHKDEVKAQRMLDFANGEIEKIVTKPKIAGLGMNWQICSNAAFIGLSDSWEQFYQAVRRIWRFGQEEEVHIHIFLEEREGAVLKNIQRKDKQAKLMVQSMIKYMKELTRKELNQSSREVTDYNPQTVMEVPKWLKN